MADIHSARGSIDPKVRSRALAGRDGRAISVCVRWLTCGLWLLAATRTTAQYDPGVAAGGGGGDEVIADPELAGSAPSSSSASSGDEVIEDPELRTNAASKRADAAASGGSAAPQSEVHLVLHTRGNRDLKEDDPREEIWESSTVLSLDATLRRSERLRFGIGLNARYHFASLAHDLPDARAQRYELDVLPTAGYVDVEPAAGLHVRAGYQTLPLGRFDFFSAINVLSVADLRDGPSAIPGTTEVGQLALLVDYDPVSWLSIRAIYVPFFMPHIVSVMESDYALFPGNQKNADAAYKALEGIVTVDDLRAQLKANLLRGARDRLAMSTLSAFAPNPTFTHPQAALRATAHGDFGELALTVLTAQEHLPTFALSDAAIAAISNPDKNAPEDPRPVSIEYPRFGIVSLDAAFDVSPFSLGFELSYQLHRVQYAVGTAYEGDPLAVPIPGFSDIVQGGARAEYVEGTTWVLGLEAFASYAISVPDDPKRAWMFLESGHFMRGVAALASYTSDFGIKLQVGGAWLTGPTVVVAPRIAYAFLDAFELEVGAFIIEGQTPPMFSTPILSMGGIYTGLDHVYVGLRAAL